MGELAIQKEAGRRSATPSTAGSSRTIAWELAMAALAMGALAVRSADGISIGLVHRHAVLEQPSDRQTGCSPFLA